MDPHPDFAEVDLPRSFDLPSFRMTPLTAEQVDEDYEAVMSSAHVLKDIFGDWPEGLTRADDLTDLHWHDREFTCRRSFSWIARDGNGTYLGCAYLFPELGTRGKTRLVTWIRDTAERDVLGTILDAEMRAWLEKHLPGNVCIR